MSATLKWLIEQNIVEGLTCLAGAQGIHREITGVNIMDNPDTVPWLKKDELVLSTGYLFSSTELYKTIISDLNERGCCALAIKMNRYLDELPAEMIEQANKLGFAILSIPFSLTLEQIVNLVYRKIFEDEMSESQHFVTLYRNITEAALKKHRLPAILESISDAFEVPAFLTNGKFEVIEYHIPKKSALSFPFPFSKDANTLFSENEIIRLTRESDDNPVPVMRHDVTIHGNPMTFLLFAIYNKSARLGYLVCPEETRRFTAFDYKLVSNIQSVLSLALMSSSLSLDGQGLDSNFFFGKILSGSVKTEEEIKPLCRQHGFDYLSPRICITMQIVGYEELSIAKRRAFERKIWSLLAPVLSETGYDYHTTVFAGAFVAFLVAKNAVLREILPKAEKAATESIRVLTQQEISAIAGIGKLTEGASGIYNSYIQSLNALELGRKLHPKATVLSFYKDRICHELSANYTHASLVEMYRELLGALDDYDVENKAELSSTLYEFLQCGLNITRASKNLYIHRNTMMYRMEQMKSLTGADFSNPDDVFLLQLGFYIKKLLAL